MTVIHITGATEKKEYQNPVQSNSTGRQSRSLLRKHFDNGKQMGIRFDEQYWRWAVDEKKDPNPIPD